jgi:hypothetical protein
MSKSNYSTYTPTGFPTLSPTEYKYIPFSNPEDFVLLFTNGFSMIGCLTVFFFLIVRNRYDRTCLQKPVNQILLYISFSTCIASFMLTFGYVKDGTPICIAQGIINNIFSLSSIMWTSVQSILFYSIAVLEKPYKLTLIFHIICWGIPLLSTFLIYTTNRIGTPNGVGWCFIASNPDSPYWGAIFWNFLSFYAWIIISELIMIYCLTSVALKFRRTRQASSVASTSTSGQRNINTSADFLWLYSVVILVCWTYSGIVDSANSISTTLTGTTIELNQIAYDCMYLALPGLQGVFISAIFMCTNKNFKSFIKYKSFAQTSRSSIVPSFKKTIGNTSSKVIHVNNSSSKEKDKVAEANLQMKKISETYDDEERVISSTILTH